MGEWADQQASDRPKNLWGTVRLIVEMQSEGGAASTIHAEILALNLAAIVRAVAQLIATRRF